MRGSREDCGQGDSYCRGSLLMALQVEEKTEGMGEMTESGVKIIFNV